MHWHVLSVGVSSLIKYTKGGIIFIRRVEGAHLTVLAVLMSGSWRTGSSVAAHNQELLLGLGVPFKFFIHTWDENIATFRNPIDTVYAHHWLFSLREPIFERFEPQIQEDYVLAHYPNATVKIDTFSAEAFYSKFYFNEPQKSTLKYLNTCAMYYGMQQSCKLLREDSSFHEYTHFMKIRPDFLLSGKDLSKIFEHPMIFFGQTVQTDKGRVSDQCFSGEIHSSLELMDAIENLEPLGTGGELIFPEDVAVSGENVLIEHIHKNEKLKALPVLFINEISPYNMIQRPKILKNLKKPIHQWLACCLLHNLKVVKNRVAGYSQILFDRLHGQMVHGKKNTTSPD